MIKKSSMMLRQLLVLRKAQLVLSRSKLFKNSVIMFGPVRIRVFSVCVTEMSLLESKYVHNTPMWKCTTTQCNNQIMKIKRSILHLSLIHI